MGWKTLKEHYQIDHLVRVEDGNICIGTNFIHDIIAIAPDGQIVKRHDRPSSNAKLDRYQRDFDADPGKLIEVINQPDRFERSIPVYTSFRDQILERYCEDFQPGNVTHCGEVMYSNTHSLDEDEVIGWALANARARVELTAERLADMRDQLAAIELRSKEALNALANLEVAYPHHA